MTARAARAGPRAAPRRARAGPAARARADLILQELRSRVDPGGVEGMRRFGITATKALGGWSLPELRRLARRVGRDHDVALELWKCGIHEARILAPMLDDPAMVTEKQMESWAGDFDSWDVVDGACGTLFDRTPFAYRKAIEWSGREEEYVKRAGFSLMCALAVHDKSAPDEAFLPFLAAVEAQAWDDRNFVRKAVNWALRQIGKRSARLHRESVRTAERILGAGTKAGQWIARDALRELGSDAVQQRLSESARRRSEPVRSTRRQTH